MNSISDATSEQEKQFGDFLAGVMESWEEAIDLVGFDRHRSPRGSPDGSTVAFLSNRALPEEKGKSEDAAKTQLWLVSAQGGEPWPLTALDRGVVDFARRDDAVLLIAAPEEDSST